MAPHICDTELASSAVERFLESAQAAATRAGSAEALAHLTAATGPRYPVPAVMERWTGLSDA
ncbi:hypothetical protein ACFYY8_37925 [Streptosporangium sp. NPDC001559]|uniref:hypothetical protein n=1 Tax=Streptosporangium sp. NPDC001559 TaxID=3366187 RepID=UPI0036ED385F